MNIQPHQERVIVEKVELERRLSDLRAFISLSPVFNQLPGAEQGRLMEQEAVMNRYLEILVQRIAAFPTV